MSGRDHSCETCGLGGMNDDRPCSCATVTYCATLEEAIAEAMSDAVDGEEIAIHSDDCACDTDGDGCTCTPEVHVVRRAAA